VAYIDNLIFFAASYGEAVDLLRKVITELEQLEWEIAWKKLMKEPK